MFPKAEFPLSSSQLRDAIAQRSDSTVVELGGEVIAFANFYRWESGGRCSIGNVIVSPAARGRGLRLFTCGCRKMRPDLVDSLNR
ncbi:MAG: GNAT family N-acetyltransferase [Acidithiobacillus ferrivorans]